MRSADFGSRIRTSLLWRTVAAVAAVCALTMAIVAGSVYSTAKKDALASQDAQLSAVAAALVRTEMSVRLPPGSTLQDSAGPGVTGGMMPGHRGMRHGHRMAGNRTGQATLPAGASVSVRVVGEGEDAVALLLTEPLSSGLSTRVIDGETHRVSLTALMNGRYAAVAESLSRIEARAGSAALDAVKPVLILLPILILVLVWLLRRTLAPLGRAAADVAKRDASELSPVSTEGVPAEVKPFVEAVNSLLTRVGDARLRELRLTADAAHELRSPLTSLTLEAEHLAKLPLTPEAREVVARLEAGLGRSVRQLTQLLQLSRAQSGEMPALLARDAAPWFLSDLTGEVLEPLLSEIDEKSLVFSMTGLEENEDAVKGVSRAAVEAVLRNLLENAVHYTPAGGAVTLGASCTPETLTLTVSDTGPGIAPSERGRVFDPFYRTPGTGLPGTGLGLAIVKTYADMTGAAVTLDSTRDDPVRPGLTVQVVFPLHPASH